MSGDDPIWVSRLTGDESGWEVHVGSKADADELKQWIASKDDIDRLEVHIDEGADIDADSVAELIHDSDVTMHIHDNQ